MATSAQEQVWSDVLQECNDLYQPCTPNTTPKLDAILYINLQSRPDRRQQIEATVESIRHLTNHVERIDAVPCKNGGKGCAQSHLKAFDRILESDWETVLILEDDAFLDMPVSEFESRVTRALQDPFDVLVCGSEVYDKEMDQFNKVCTPVTMAQCTTSYIIRKSYVPVLKRAWQHCESNLGPVLDKREYRIFAIDQGWKRLSAIHNWKWLVGNAFRQRPGFSDIEGKVVNYKWHPRKTETVK